MNVQLTQEMEQMIQDRVQSGRYASASDVVTDALRLLGHCDEILIGDPAVGQKIDEGWAAAQRGEFVEGAELFDRIDAELSQGEGTSYR